MANFGLTWPYKPEIGELGSMDGIEWLGGLVGVSLNLLLHHGLPGGLEGHLERWFACGIGR